MCLTVQLSFFQFHVPIGKIYLKQKQYEKALEHFRKARSINVTNSIAWKNEFYILLSLNRVDEAVLPLNKYIELLPNDPEIEKMKAELLGTNKKGLY